MKIKNTIYLVICIIMVCAATACQPTPVEPIVQSKDKDLVEEVIEANQEENQEELAEDKEVIEQQIEAIDKHLDMEFQANERVKIVVDAAVSIPSYDKIPMVRVAPDNFTEEHLQMLINEVFGDNPVYFQSESHWSKEEIEDILLSLRAFNQNDNLESHIKSHLESSIEFLEERRTGAISKGEETLYDGTLVPAENNKYYSHITSLKSYLGKSQAARIELWQSFNGNRGQLVFRNEDYGVTYNTFELYEGIDAEKINMSYEECRDIAERLVKAFDGNDTNMDIYSSGIGYSIGFFADYTKEASPQCYTFRFARNYEGVFAKNIAGLHNMSEVNYSERIQTERMTITIDNDGIYSVTWGNYSRFVEKLTQDVPLMDFESVNNIFKDYCGYKFTWVPQYDNIPDDTTVTINISKVELNLMMTLEKDNEDSYIMIPVWDFIGDINYDQELIAQDGYPIHAEKNVAILTINAIDGTVIDREQGY